MPSDAGAPLTERAQHGSSFARSKSFGRLSLRALFLTVATRAWFGCTAVVLAIDHFTMLTHYYCVVFFAMVVCCDEENVKRIGRC